MDGKRIEIDSGDKVGLVSEVALQLAENGATRDDVEKLWRSDKITARERNDYAKLWNKTHRFGGPMKDVSEALYD